jgi:phage-related protein
MNIFNVFLDVIRTVWLNLSGVFNFLIDNVPKLVNTIITFLQWGLNFIVGSINTIINTIQSIIKFFS